MTGHGIMNSAAKEDDGQIYQDEDGQRHGMNTDRSKQKPRANRGAGNRGLARESHKPATFPTYLEGRTPTNKPSPSQPGPRGTEEIRMSVQADKSGLKIHDPPVDLRETTADGHLQYHRARTKLRAHLHTYAHKFFSLGETRPGFPFYPLENSVSPSPFPSATADYSILGSGTRLRRGKPAWFAVSLERRTSTTAFTCARRSSYDLSSIHRAVEIP